MVHEEFPGALTLAEESTAWPMVSRPDLPGRPGLLHEVEHGLDERHAVATCGSIRFTAATTTTSSPSASSTPTPRTSCCRCRTTRWCTARARCWTRCRATPGRSSPTCGCCSPTSSPRPARSSTSWATSSPRGANGARAGSSTGGCSRCDWHAGVQRLMRDLNRLHRDVPALHEQDFAPEGFSWIDCHDADHSTMSFVRRARDGCFRRRGAQLHTGAARELPHRLARGRALRRDPQQRLGLLRRQQRRQCRRHRGAGAALDGAGLLRRHHPAAAGRRWCSSRSAGDGRRASTRSCSSPPRWRPWSRPAGWPTSAARCRPR